MSGFDDPDDGGSGGADGADEFDRLRRRVLWAMPTGLFVVGSRAGDRRNLMTANWVMQVATSPKLMSVAVESGSLTRELIEEGGAFSVCLLARSERSLVRRFVKPVRDIVLDEDGVAVSLQGEPVFEFTHGLPVPLAAVGWLACEVRSVQEWDAGHDEASHVLVVGEVVDAGESERLGTSGDDNTVLSVADTRMNYGG
jgi:flavin reductase (DIM6/NTAB) family NADH-FMN oxidoreductase RutF